MSSNMLTLSVVIPSYQRGEVLLDTLDQLKQQKEHANEVIVVDQTDYEDSDRIFNILENRHKTGEIQWRRLTEPSIPVAMNTGLKLAKSDLVLFLDDDVILSKTLIQEHKRAFKNGKVIATVGQILQPEQTESKINSYQSRQGLKQDLNFPFNGNLQVVIHNCMAGNLCVRRKQAKAVGGFDERFYSVAYRFETDFCRRLIQHTNKDFLFLPKAGLFHLKCERGGTRSRHADFLKSAAPDHSYGDYYFALKHGSFFSSINYMFSRFFGSLYTRFYVKHPWWLPVRIVGELRGLLKAIILKYKGPVYINE